MELQALEAQVCARINTRGLEMAILVKISSTIVSVISHLSRGERNWI